ncbi:MAG: Na+/H+ antiporter subunit E [Limisphaerales bacterium]
MNIFLLNLMLALVWMFLQPRPGVGPFFTGYALGFALLWLFRPVLPDAAYVRRTAAFVRFVAIFLREFLAANLQLLRIVLFTPRARLRPGFVTYDVSGLRPHEILLLSHCLTLTPGSTSVEISDDGRTLVLHALEAGDPAAVRRGIDAGLRASLLAFTR